MRPIKFRMWDMKSQQWSHACATEFQRYGFLDLSKKNEKEGIILSQFTGLLDKNGKEIYEGDLVTGEYYTFELEHIKAHIVSYGEIEGEYDNAMGFSGISKHCEVIGNIYENPELLTK